MFQKFVDRVKEDVDPRSLIRETSKEIGQASPEADKKSHREQLLEALRKENPHEVLAVIVRGNKENAAKTLRTLNYDCRVVAQRQEQRRHLIREEDCLSCSIKKIPKRILACIKKCCWGCCSQCCTDYQQPTEDQIEEEKHWIEILSNPLYISLEWLWRIHSKSGTVVTTLEGNGNMPQEVLIMEQREAFTCAKYAEEEKEKENENQDVVATALRDSHLLEMIAGNDQHKDEYQRRANQIEEFAIAVVGGSTRDQLIDIMDKRGNGCLKQKAPKKFSQSLSLLKIAAVEERKKFVASAKCESILNEVIYFGWPGWQKKERIPKILWSFLVLLLTITLCIPYTLYRAFKDCFCRSCCHQGGPKCWKFFQQWFEHPYYKFVNHTTWYMAFLALLFACSFHGQDTLEGTWTGLDGIDRVVLAFVLGFLVQEVVAVSREGFHVYKSKWWNVVDSLIILAFVVSYVIWYSGNKWNPENVTFVVADVIFSSAIVMSFFHLTHIFQVNSVLGPLQLSLYRMLNDVFHFLLLFLVLYLSFATGLAKIYRYYVASQLELKKRNETHHEETHPYTSHWNVLNGLFWLLLGNYDEEKVRVKDSDFWTTSICGHIFMIVYVICMVIVALNMLIAMMNNSFQRCMEDSDVWKFSRARMWLESIDKGHVIPSPLNLLYYILKVITKVILMTRKTNRCCLCHCSCQKGSGYFEGQEEIFQKRLKTMKTLVVKFLEDRYTWDGKEVEGNKEDLRQELAKISSDMATLCKRIESISKQ
ncbi:short transient receptor potential channel 5-like isoform X1 [Acropora muricata]|uniref:short transient receptor potential channel 5-like isoform X1 n=1 Tax=Acropora muricata TaxID=159855 RepID=UPI0034E4AC1E